MIQNSEDLLRWAETHQADIHIEPDTLDGRKVRKVTLRWPGPAGPEAHPQVDTVWFDPDSLRPVKAASEQWDGGLTEATVRLSCTRERPGGPAHVPAAPRT